MNLMIDGMSNTSHPVFCLTPQSKSMKTSSLWTITQNSTEKPVIETGRNDGLKLRVRIDWEAMLQREMLLSMQETTTRRHLCHPFGRK